MGVTLNYYIKLMIEDGNGILNCRICGGQMCGLGTKWFKINSQETLNDHLISHLKNGDFIRHIHRFEIALGEP